MPSLTDYFNSPSSLTLEQKKQLLKNYGYDSDRIDSVKEPYVDAQLRRLLQAGHTGEFPQ